MIRCMLKCMLSVTRGLLVGLCGHLLLLLLDARLCLLPYYPDTRL